MPYFKNSGINTSDATAKSNDILSGKTAYVNGSKVTGNISSKAAATYTPSTSNQTISSGQYLSGNQTIKGDSNLVANNIKKGVSIFGINGNYNPLAVDVSNVSVGDEVTIFHNIFGALPFIVIGKNHDAPNSVTLLTKYVLDLGYCFDAGETSNGLEYAGNGIYKYSNILQWMNSAAAGGSWYTAQHKNDKPPTVAYTFHDDKYSSSYYYADGLLRGFSSDVVDQMITVSKPTRIWTGVAGSNNTTILETISSKVFFLSVDEIYNGDGTGKSEGKVYEYFNVDDSTRIKRIRGRVDNNRIFRKKLDNDDYYYYGFHPDYYYMDWWLRTCVSYTFREDDPDYFVAFPAVCCAGESTAQTEYEFNAYVGKADAIKTYIGLRFAICLKTS